jgi:hypothetical protein
MIANTRSIRQRWQARERGRSGLFGITPARFYHLLPVTWPLGHRLLIEVRQEICIFKVVDRSKASPIQDLVDQEEYDEKKWLGALVSIFKTRKLETLTPAYSPRSSPTSEVDGLIEFAGRTESRFLRR